MQSYKPKEFAEQIGIHVRTLYRWDKEGIFLAKRNVRGKRYYTDEDLKKYFGEEIEKNENHANN